ncbi:hypothetical protein [Serratia fonticola]
MLPIDSARDVFVEIHGEKYRFCDMPYNYLIKCSRASGWQLWRLDERFNGVDDDLLSSENGLIASSHPFKMWFGDQLVFDSAKKQ